MGESDIAPPLWLNDRCADVGPLPTSPVGARCAQLACVRLRFGSGAGCCSATGSSSTRPTVGGLPTAPAHTRWRASPRTMCPGTTTADRPTPHPLGGVNLGAWILGQRRPYEKHLLRAAHAFPPEGPGDTLGQLQHRQRTAAWWPVRREGGALPRVGAGLHKGMTAHRRARHADAHIDGAVGRRSQLLSGGAWPQPSPMQPWR